MIKPPLHNKLHQVKRILIIGDPGSGKNYLGERLAAHFKISFKDMDDFIWKRRFDISRPKLERKKLLAKAVKKESWLFAGIPSSWMQSAIVSAQVIIILKESLFIETMRVMLRFLKRKFTTNYKETLKGLKELIIYDYSEFHKLTGNKKMMMGEINKKYNSKTYILNSKSEVNILLQMLSGK